MTGTLLLAFVALAWFCYTTIGVFVAIGGDERLPRFLKPLLERAANYSTTWVGQVGAAVVGGIWLILAILPQVALVREVTIGRASAVETVAIVLNVFGCLAWLVFLMSRYRGR